jgi:hypothetical protein
VFSNHCADERAELLCVQWMTISPIWARLRVPLRRTALYCREQAASIGCAGRSRSVDSAPAKSPGTVQS